MAIQSNEKKSAQAQALEFSKEMADIMMDVVLNIPRGLKESDFSEEVYKDLLIKNNRLNACIDKGDDILSHMRATTERKVKGSEEKQTVINKTYASIDEPLKKLKAQQIVLNNIVDEMSAFFNKKSILEALDNPVPAQFNELHSDYCSFITDDDYAASKREFIKELSRLLGVSNESQGVEIVFDCWGQRYDVGCQIKTDNENDFVLNIKDDQELSAVTKTLEHYNITNVVLYITECDACKLTYILKHFMTNNYKLENIIKVYDNIIERLGYKFTK